MLSKRSQPHKATYCLIPFTLNVCIRQTHGSRKDPGATGWSGECSGRGERGMTANWPGFLLRWWRCSGTWLDCALCKSECHGVWKCCEHHVTLCLTYIRPYLCLLKPAKTTAVKVDCLLTRRKNKLCHAGWKLPDFPALSEAGTIHEWRASP